MLGKGREAVGPEVGVVGRGDAAAGVTEADRQGLRGCWCCLATALVLGIGGKFFGGWGRGDGDLDWFALGSFFNDGAEGVLKELGEYIFQVDGYMCDAGFEVAINNHVRPHAVAELADFGDEGFALADYGNGAQGGIDDADVG